MESSIPENHKWKHLIRALVAEFCGGALTVYAFNFTTASYIARAFAYFVGWLMAVSISGAHFNPATTLGVFLAEGKYGKQVARMLLYWLFQLMGAFAGVLITYLMFNEPVEGYLLWPLSQNRDVATRFFSELGNLYYAKICFLEALNTFTFVYVYLLIIYKPQLRTVDEIIKGVGVAITLWICYELSAGAGACYNPALAIAQVSYQVGFLNGMDFDGNRFASPIWCYIVFPLIGAIVAAIAFRVHIKLDNQALKEEQVAGVAEEVVAS